MYIPSMFTFIFACDTLIMMIHSYQYLTIVHFLTFVVSLKNARKKDQNALEGKKCRC